MYFFRRALKDGIWNLKTFASLYRPGKYKVIHLEFLGNTVLFLLNFGVGFVVWKFSGYTLFSILKIVLIYWHVSDDVNY